MIFQIVLGIYFLVCGFTVPIMAIVLLNKKIKERRTLYNEKPEHKE